MVVKEVVQVVVVVMVVKVALPDETDLRRARVHSAARWGSQICKSLVWLRTEDSCVIDLHNCPTLTRGRS